jgi:hypothetical protein
MHQIYSNSSRPNIIWAPITFLVLGVVVAICTTYYTVQLETFFAGSTPQAITNIMKNLPQNIPTVPGMPTTSQ